jgi:hypothetical protein
MPVVPNSPPAPSVPLVIPNVTPAPTLVPPIPSLGVREPSDASVELFFSVRHDSLPDLEDKLFCAYLRALFASESVGYVWTLRSLANRTGVSRMTLSRRLQALVEAGRLSDSELPSHFRRRNAPARRKE